MKTTQLYRLPFPEGEDFGNGALDLQYFAESVETQLVSLQNGLTAQLNTQGFILQTTADITGIASGSEAVPFASQTLNYFGLGTPSAIWNTTGSGTTVTIPESGSYMFGAYCNLIASGTVNANTLRTLTLGASVPAGAQFTTQKQYLYRSTTLDQNTGVGVYLCVSGFFDYTFIDTSRPGGDPATPGFWLSVSHANASSTLTLKAGALYWAIKVADIAS